MFDVHELYKPKAKERCQLICSHSFPQASKQWNILVEAGRSIL